LGFFDNSDKKARTVKARHNLFDECDDVELKIRFRLSKSTVKKFQCAAELRILLVYLSESLGRLGQNGEGALRGAHFSLEGGTAPCPSRRTAPDVRKK